MMFVYFASFLIGTYVLNYFLWSDYWYLSLAYVSWVIFDNLHTPTGESEFLAHDACEALEHFAVARHPGRRLCRSPIQKKSQDVS